MSTEQPLVLTFEDVHWLDPSSSVLVQSLLPLTAEAPIIICLVGRGGADSLALELLDAAHKGEGLRCIVIQLNRLSRRHTQNLVRNLLGGSEMGRG